MISKWALNFGVVLRSPDFQILPEAKGDIPRQHNLAFYYPNLHSFFQVLLSLHSFELPSAHLSLTNQQGMCQFVMPNCWGCVPAIVLPAAEPALPSMHTKDLWRKDFKSQTHPNTDDKVGTLNISLIYAKELNPSVFRRNSQKEKNWKRPVRLK